MTAPRMSKAERYAAIVAMTKDRLSELHETQGQIVDMIAPYRPKNLDWYLAERIIKAPDVEALRDNLHAVAYALQFAAAGAAVEFLIERKNAKTPDLHVDLDGKVIYAEVHRLRTGPPGPINEVGKIVYAVERKSLQLPPDEIGVTVIIDRDLKLERNLSYEFFNQAIERLDYLVGTEPSEWARPSAAVFALRTSGGVRLGDPGSFSFPKWVWTNNATQPKMPRELAEWLISAVNGGVAIRR
jgi:hypothetical protein